MSESFNRALRSAARRGRPAGVCPDAAMLAAYADNGLTADERRVVETHAADCAPCLEHLALLGAVSLDRDAPEPSRSWLVRWGWLVPVATAVVVVAVWVRLPEQKAAPDAPTTLEDSRPDVARRSEPQADPSIEQPAGMTPRAKYDLAKKAPPPVADNLAQSARDARTMSAKTKADELAPLERRDAFSQTAERASPAGAAPPAVPAPREQEAGQEKVQSLRVGNAASKVATPQAAAAPALSDAMKEEAMAESVAPRETYRARGNRIEQSRDGGTTWSSVLSEPQSTFTVVGCAQNGPCWIGTADGQVLRRTPDGFARSVLPVRARVGAIAAEGALSVVVTVEGGQRFRTADGGITWNLIP